MSSELKSFEFSKPAGQKKKALLDEPVKEQPVPLKETARDELKEPEKKEEDKPKSKYEQTELLAIFDEIIFSGEYAETVSIKGKLNIVFRTRTAKETEEIAQSLDSLGANLFATLEQKRSILNLTYSMVKYQTKDLLLLKKAEREEFIGRLPGPVIAALINALARFDEKVFEACREAEESF